MVPSVIESNMRGDRLETWICRRICDEPGYLNFSRTGAELLFKAAADRYEMGDLPTASNLAVSKWVQVLQREQKTSAWLDRLTYK